VLAVLAPLLLFGIAAHNDWQAIESDARARIVYIRDAIAEHAKRVFQTHELVGLSIRERIAPMSWTEIEQSRDLHLYLRQVEADFPEVHAIWLVDGEGVLRASSRAMPAPAVDLTDRDWFATMRAQEAPLLVGARQTGRIHSDDFFSITLPRREDVFDGLIRISITPDYFTEFYRSAYPDEGLIALFRQDGEVLVAYPPGADIPVRLPETSSVFPWIAEYRGAVWDAPSALDGERRLNAVTRLGELPVYAAFAVSRDSLEALWRRQVLGYAAFFLPAGVALIFLGILAWRSHRALEEKVELRTRALSEAVAEKNQLLKEVHHRVKNNMQIVSSLIRMQERVHTSPDETIRRVQAMALVHDLIYSHGEFASVNLGAYTRRLGDTLAGTAAGKSRIAFTYDLDHVAASLDRAMPFALILSEVVTNAMRHAFPGEKGHIAIALARVDGRAVLRVADDGSGFDPHQQTDGFGLKLIHSLAVQLDAQVRFEADGGAVFLMEFPLDETSPGA